MVVDANPAKEAVARQFGATDFLDGSALTGDGELVQAVKDLGLPNGVDHAFECVGHPALIRHAIDLLDWGGQCILLGVPKLGTEASFVINTLYNQDGVVRSDAWDRLAGSYHGSGCTLAAAVAATLANGLAMEEAVRDAQEFTWQSLKQGFRPGMGQHIPDRMFWARDDEDGKD